MRVKHEDQIAAIKEQKAEKLGQIETDEAVQLEDLREGGDSIEKILTSVLAVISARYSIWILSKVLIFEHFISVGGSSSQNSNQNFSIELGPRVARLAILRAMSTGRHAGKSMTRLLTRSVQRGTRNWTLFAKRHKRLRSRLRLIPRRSWP